MSTDDAERLKAIEADVERTRREYDRLVLVKHDDAAWLLAECRRLTAELAEAKQSLKTVVDGLPEAVDAAIEGGRLQERERCEKIAKEAAETLQRIAADERKSGNRREANYRHNCSVVVREVANDIAKGA